MMLSGVPRVCSPASQPRRVSATCVSAHQCALQRLMQQVTQRRKQQQQVPATAPPPPPPPPPPQGPAATTYGSGGDFPDDAASHLTKVYRTVTSVSEDLAPAVAVVAGLYGASLMLRKWALAPVYNEIKEVARKQDNLATNKSVNDLENEIKEVARKQDNLATNKSVNDLEKKMDKRLDRQMFVAIIGQLASVFVITYTNK